MALGENQNKIQYTVTTSNDSFDFPYKYWADSEIVVTKLASGVESNPDFTIVATNGDKDNGGTVTLGTAVTSCTITIERIVAIESEANYRRGALSPVSLTEQFDKGIAVSQQLAEKVGRQIKLPTTDPSGLNYEVDSVVNRASKMLGFDASGNITEYSLKDIGSVAADNAAGVEILNTSTEADEVTLTITGGKYAIKELADNSVTNAQLDDVGKMVEFTPTITQGSALTTSALTAKYTITNNTVFASIDATLNSGGSSGSTIFISNLPAGGVRTGSWVAIVDGDTYTGTVQGAANNSTIHLRNAGGNVLGQNPPLALASGDRIVVGITYVKA